MAGAASDRDRPMHLGDHLEELRTRLLRSLLVSGIIAIVAFAFQGHLIPWSKWPLEQAIASLDDETVATFGQTRADLTSFHHLGPVEGPMISIKLSLFVAIVVGFPFLVAQIWGFVMPGLHRHERRIGFLLVPAAVIFFYSGLTLGFLYGLPFLIQVLYEYNARFIPGVRMLLTHSLYYSLVFMMSILFGAIMDIPWLILVLVRARVVTPDAIARKRKVIIIVAAVMAAMLTPPDPISQIVVLGLIIALFESGLLAARVMYRRQRRREAAAEGRPFKVGEDGLIGHLIDLPVEERPAATEAPPKQVDRPDPVASPDTSSSGGSTGEDASAASEADPEEGSAEVPAEFPEDPPADPWVRGSRRRKAAPPAVGDQVVPGSEQPEDETGPSEGSAGDDAPADDPWSQGRSRDQDPDADQRADDEEERR